MKKAITILTICLLTFTGMQTAEAQTKEETITWIKEKLEKYGGFEYIYFKDVQVSPCKISFTASYPSSSYSQSFNPSTVKEWKIASNKKYIYADANVIHSVDSDGDVDTYSIFGIKNGEANIHERMIKALLHLATFCNE